MKIQKNLFWGHVAILAFFVQIWAKMNIPGKKALSVFKYSNYIYLDGGTDRQPWFCRTLCRAGGPIIKVTLSFPEFISKHQNPVYSIKIFVRYSQFRYLQPEWAHPFMTTPMPIFFNFNEFVSTCKKSGFFIFSF